MNGWLNLWTGVLVATLALFTCLTVAVTVGGFVDIRKMLRELRRQHEDAANADRQRPDA